MSEPQLESIEGDRLLLSSLDPHFALCLSEVAVILDERNSPAARQRLFPAPTAHDTEWNASWLHLVTPDLEMLFQSAAELMAKDLTKMSLDPKRTATYRVEIPSAHVNAWMSALNQARLVLGAKYKSAERDMNRTTKFDPHKPRDVAVVKIHLLGHLLQLFIEFQGRRL